MTRTLKPTFATTTNAPSDATASSTSSVSSERTSQLADRLAKLAPEQLAAIEQHLDELEGGEPNEAARAALDERAERRHALLEAGATVEPGPAPLEVLATRWWFPAEGSDQPIAIQRVRGLAFTVLQVPEHGHAHPRFCAMGGSLASTLRVIPDALAQWFDDAARVPTKAIGNVPAAFAAGPPVAPWTVSKGPRS